MDIELSDTKVGDYYIPNLILDEPEELRGFMGKYAGLRRAYLKEHRPDLWMLLVNSGRIVDHLREVEDAANTRLASLLPVLAESVGATETLKANDPCGGSAR